MAHWSCTDCSKTSSSGLWLLARLEILYSRVRTLLYRLSNWNDSTSRCLNRRRADTSLSIILVSNPIAERRISPANSCLGDYFVPKSAAEHPLFGSSPSKYSAEKYHGADSNPPPSSCSADGDVELDLVGGVQEGIARKLETASPESELTQYSIANNLFDRVHPSDQCTTRGAARGDRTELAEESPDVTTISFDSIDSDMLSIPDFSERLDPFGLGPTACEVLTRVLHLLMDEWQVWIKSCTQSSEASHQPCTAGSSQPGEPPSSATGSSLSLKRDRSPEDQDEDSRRRGSALPVKRSKSDDLTRKLFACPFWKKSPSTHQMCFSMKLARIRDVKQHLARKHTPNYYCERCFEVFEQKQSHTAHVMSAESCHPRPLETLDGVSNDQRKALSKKSKRLQTASQQWYAVWDILFVNTPRPESPYMDFEQSRDFDSFRRFCSPRVGTVLAEQLTDEVLRAMLGTPTSERLPMVLQLVESGFQTAWESFVATAATVAVDEETPPIGDSISSDFPWTSQAQTRDTSSSSEEQFQVVHGQSARPTPQDSVSASMPAATSQPHELLQRNTEPQPEAAVESANEAAHEATDAGYFDWDDIGAYIFPDDSLEPVVGGPFFDEEPFELGTNFAGESVQHESPGVSIHQPPVSIHQPPISMRHPQSVERPA